MILSVLLLVGVVNAVAQPFSVADLPAVRAPRAAEALLLDVARAGDRLVAVGMQGVIVTSDDNGVSWTQAAVPVSTMLTAVAIADAQRGWAVGHAGIVLRSGDGGRSWRRVPLLAAVAGLAEAGPGSATPATDGDGILLFHAAADASFLDVLVLAPGNVLVAGAYGALFATHDDGATWARLAPPAEDLHINRLTRGRDGAIYLAGESGTLAVSRDEGATWTLLDAPYDGSFYGLIELTSGRLLAHGLRGHVFTSDDAGENWVERAINQPVLLTSACEVKSGVVVLGATGGHLFVSRDEGATFAHHEPDGLGGTTRIIAAADGALIAAGERGVQRRDLP